MLKLNQLLNQILSILTAFALIVMMLHVVAHALGRFLFASPIYGTNEMVAYWYLPVVALLGIPAAHLQKEQITVTLFVERMNTTTASFFKIFACILGFLMSLGFAWFGFTEARENLAIGSTAGVTDIVTWPVHFLVSLVFVLMAVLYLTNIVLTLRTGDPEAELLPNRRANRDVEDAIA